MLKAKVKTKNLEIMGKLLAAQLEKGSDQNNLLSCGTEVNR